jgi:hypothetical protein
MDARMVRQYLTSFSSRVRESLSQFWATDANLMAEELPKYPVGLLSSIAAPARNELLAGSRLTEPCLSSCSELAEWVCRALVLSGLLR